MSLGRISGLNLNVDNKRSTLNNDMLNEMLVDGNSVDLENNKTAKEKRKRRETVYKSVVIGSKKSTLMSGININFAYLLI